jgi:protein phosphatase
MQLIIPEYALILLIGPSGAGKSTFARQHFLPGEVLSSDTFRQMVGNDENRLDISETAFDALFYVLQKRLDNALLTVIDATNVQPLDRKRLIDLAKRNHVFPVAIVLDTPVSVCYERNQNRPERAHLDVGVPKAQSMHLRRNLGSLQKEGFRFVYHLRTQEEVDAVEIIRTPLLMNKKHEKGPFHIIGDVHGCFAELVELLEKLRWNIKKDAETGHFRTTPPEGRRAIFVGDYTDRGPDSPQVLRLVMDMVAAGHAFCVPGNHDAKLQRWLEGREVQTTHGLQSTVEQLAAYSDTFKKEVRDFIDSLVSHLIFDEGRLVVAHAGIKELYVGRTSGKVREFCLYGDTSGETDEYGMPVRLNWAADYRGKPSIVYGHTPTPEAQWLNNTICVDTGCVFGGKLTALCYPERTLVHVDAKQEYYAPKRPLVPASATNASLQTQYDDLLDAQDILDKKQIETRLMGVLKLRPLDAAKAFESLCRFGVHPQWLTYLPPTMSPSETSQLPDLLEHPEQAFAYFAQNGVETVVCQEKHMGSRAVLTLCKDDETAARRFGITDASAVCYTRTGRRFFTDDATETAFFEAIRKVLDNAGFWEKFETDWVTLDAELMPWSAKAQGLLEKQYAPVGTSAVRSLAAVAVQLEKATHIPEAAALLANVREREHCALAFQTAYRQYCWPVQSVADLRFAPFHLLAVEGRTFFDRDHLWHMNTLADIAAANPNSIWMATKTMTVLTNDPASVQTGTDWWKEMTAAGGEGMVVKPLDFVVRSEKGLVQPAIKVRGREYLRIIYGPEYTLPEHMERLRARGISVKRHLALREFALGAEGLMRFVDREPLRRVHECVFGVLTLESDGGDPRL